MSMAADRKWDDATRKRVIEKYKKGMKLKQISAEEGTPIATIYNILKLAGEAPRRMTRRKTLGSSVDEQVEQLEWLVSRLFELQTENARLLDILAEYGINPETGEIEQGNE